MFNNSNNRVYIPASYLDTVYMYVFVPTALLGFTLNTLSLVILQRREQFGRPMYAYLRALTWLGVVGNLVAVAYGVLQCPHILPTVANTYAGQFYKSYVYIPIYNMAYYARFLIDIAKKLDQISTFSLRRSMYLGLRPWHVVLITLLITLLVNYPYLYLVYSPQSFQIVNNNPAERAALHSDTFHFFHLTEWASSAAGRLTLNLVYVVKHGMTLGIDVILNIIWFALFKPYYTHKSNTINGSLLLKNDQQSCQAEANVVQGVKSKRMGSNASMSSVHGRLRNLNSEKKMSDMVLLNSVMCVLHHLVLVGFTAYYLNSSARNLTVEVMSLAAHYASVLRHASCFFMFYGFNSSFRNECKYLFGVRKRPLTAAGTVTEEQEQAVLRRRSIRQQNEFYLNVSK
jgi:hypothetical protein